MFDNLEARYILAKKKSRKKQSIKNPENSAVDCEDFVKNFIT